MKRFIFFISSILAFLFLSCDDFSNLAVPESVSVTTKADYSFPVGNTSLSLSEKINISKIKDILIENSDSENPASVYDYNPTNSDSAVMQYVLNYPIKEIPFSLADSDTDLSNIVIPDTEFSAPDFSSDITSAIAIDNKSFPVVETGSSGSLSDISFDCNISTPTFSTMTVRSGKLNINVTTPSGVSSDFVLTLSVKLVNASDTSSVISESGSSSISPASGDFTTISLDLAGKTLVPEMKVLLTGSISGGSLGNTNTYTVKMAPESLAISTITGLTLTESQMSTSTITINESFPINGLNDSLKQATVKSGYIQFYCKLPDGWSGITADDSESTYAIAQEDDSTYTGLSLGNADFTTLANESGQVFNKKADLTNKNINSKNAATNGTSVKIKVENATIVFPESGSSKFVLAGLCNIEQPLKNLVITLSTLATMQDTIDTGLDFSSIVGSIFSGSNSDLIKNIKFEDSDLAKFAGYLYVTQPTDNETLSGLSITGNIWAPYTASDGTVKSPDFIGSNGSSSSPTTASMSMKKTNVVFSSYADSVITDTKPFQEENYSAKIPDGVILDIFNDQPSSLTVSYNLTLTSCSDSIITLTESELAAMDTSASISISVAMIVPIQISFHDISDGTSDSSVTISDVLEFLRGSSSDEDLLKRDSADSTKDFEKYCDAIKSMTMNYTVGNNALLNVSEFTDSSGVTHPQGETLGMTARMYDAGQSGLNEVIDSSPGSHSMEFTTEEIRGILKNYPLLLRVSAGIPAYEKPYYVPRSAAFSMTGNIAIHTDGTVELWSK